MNLKQLKKLSAKEWQILLTSLFLLPSIALALHFKGFKWTQNYLQNHIPQSKQPSPQLPQQTAQSVARMVSVAANLGPYRANCLKRSLATWWLLQRRGIAAELNIGINKDSGDFTAHAWVEFMGETLHEPDNTTQHYSSFGPQ